MRSWLNRQRGQGIVEFAAIFPIFALLVFAVIDGGLVMGRYSQANQAAGVGARLAATTGGDFGDVHDAVEDAVRGQLHDELTTANCDAGGPVGNPNSQGDDLCIDFR
jgi:Flp pilus assembly protein TadG